MNEIGPSLKVALAILAAWRVTHLLANEDGPFDLIFRFRALFRQGVVGRMLDCFNCLSLWVAAPIALLITRQPAGLFLSWLAISGGACILQRLGHDPVIVHPLMRGTEEEDDSNALLRSEESGAQEPADRNRSPSTGERG